jgi:hypothetical protein
MTFYMLDYLLISFKIRHEIRGGIRCSLSFTRQQEEEIKMRDIHKYSHFNEGDMCSRIGTRPATAF